MFVYIFSLVSIRETKLHVSFWKVPFFIKSCVLALHRVPVTVGGWSRSDCSAAREEPCRFCTLRPKWGGFSLIRRSSSSKLPMPGPTRMGLEQRPDHSLPAAPSCGKTTLKITISGNCFP